MERSAGRTSATLAVLCGLACAGCVHPLKIAVPARIGVDPKQPGTFVAGTHRVDITPIPGVPLGGYSLGGKASRGFWTRLYARALYLKDASGTPLVLVSTDLGAIPGGLGDEVTRLLHAQHGLTWIGREHVVLSATHTHHGPGNFYSNELFNQMVSPWPDFDESLFHFLANRIAAAVAEARNHASAAELFVTDATVLEATNDWKLDRFFRNRSLPAFLLNRRSSTFLDPDVSTGCRLLPDDPDTLEDESDERACTAVRPQVELLGVRHTGSSRFAGVAAFVPVHPTVLPPTLEVYSSDLFGVADAALEERSQCAKLEKDPVVAFFNGAAGDVSPTWKARNRKEVMELGRTLADKVCELLDHVKTTDTAIHFRHARVELAGQEFTEHDPTRIPTDVVRRTTRSGRSGAATVGGAEDGRTLLHKFLGHREGTTRVARREHGPKAPVGEVEAVGLGEAGVMGVGQAQVLEAWLDQPPAVAPLAVYTIGSTAPNVAIVAVPGELTTQMGRRVRQAVFDALPAPRPAKAEHVLVIGLANEYIGYLTTPEEYDAQHYEGAMTVYGPASGPFLAQELARLAGLAQDEPALPKAELHTYFPGSRTEFQPNDVWGAPYSKDDGLADLTQDLAALPNVRRDLPTYCWRDVVPRLEELSPAQPCLRSNPDVTVARKIAFGMTTIWSPVADNRGSDIVTVMTGIGRDSASAFWTDWCAIWLFDAALAEPTRTQDYRFEVVDLTGDDWESKVFGLVDSQPDGWLDQRFLQQPAQPLEPQPFASIPVGSECTVPGTP